LENNVFFEYVFDGLDNVFCFALCELYNRAGLENTAIRSKLGNLLQFLGIFLGGGDSGSGRLGSSLCR
jgi:hypothetical protein